VSQVEKEEENQKELNKGRFKRYNRGAPAAGGLGKGGVALRCGFTPTYTCGN